LGGDDEAPMWMFVFVYGYAKWEQEVERKSMDVGEWEKVLLSPFRGSYQPFVQENGGASGEEKGGRVRKKGKVGVGYACVRVCYCVCACGDDECESGWNDGDGDRGADDESGECVVVLERVRENLNSPKSWNCCFLFVPFFLSDDHSRQKGKEREEEY
jgi:hypothetical protein